MAPAPNNWAAARPGTSLSYPDALFRPRNKIGPTVLAATGVPAATLVLPGPPAGFVRCYDPIVSSPVVGVTLATGSITATVLPSNQLLARLPINASGQATSSGIRVRPIMPGESLRLVNTGVNATAIVTTYVDIAQGLRPDGTANIRALDLVLSTVAVDVLPAPPAGYLHRWLLLGDSGAMGATGGLGSATLGTSGVTLMPKLNFINLDTVQHGVQFTQGGVLVSRFPATSAFLNANVIQPPFTPIGQWTRESADPALQLVLTEVVVTTAPILSGAYELVPV